MKNKIIFATLLLFLAIHLLYTNSSLLIDLQTMRDDAELSLNAKLLKGVFALSYSILTVAILSLYPRLLIVIVASLLDGFGVYMQYNVEQHNFVQLTSIYFAIYTVLIVISSGIIANSREKKTINIIPSNKLDIEDLKKRQLSINRALARLKDQNKREELQNELALITQTIENQK